MLLPKILLSSVQTIYRVQTRRVILGYTCKTKNEKIKFFNLFYKEIKRNIKFNILNEYFLSTIVIDVFYDQLRDI